MTLALLLLGLVFGACIGSFCNVVIIRMHEGETLGGRSRCIHCHTTLSSRHLIPIVSWVVLRARCAFCREPIHWQYPVVETVGALIGVCAVWSSIHPAGVDWKHVVFTLVFLCILLVIAAFDARWQLVPVEFTLWSAFVIALARLGIEGPAQLLTMLMGAGLTAGGLWLIVRLSRGRLMGEGDPIVAVLIGAALGWPLAPVALGVAFMLGGAVATVLLVAGRVRRDTAVPFIPFFAIGAFVAYFWGSQMLALFSNALS